MGRIARLGAIRRSLGGTIGTINDISSELQDLTHLDWSESSTSSATGGSYLKARQGEGSDAIYYKLSCYDDVNGIYGHECVNELIASRLMHVLCVSHVPYKLVHAIVRVNGHDHETWLARSASFRKRGESKTSLARFYGWNHLSGESRMDFCARFGWTQDVQKTMLIDYLIANRDRHGGNIEVVKSKNGQVRLAPLFDNGLSLCFSAYTSKQLRAIDPTQDIVSNNYLGTRSLEENLTRFVPGNLPIGRLQPTHEQYVMQGLAPALEHAVADVSPEDFLDFLWHMIWERWCVYESLRDSGQLETQG